MTVNGQSVVAADLDTADTAAQQLPSNSVEESTASEVTEAIASASEAPAYAETEQPVVDASWSRNCVSRSYTSEAETTQLLKHQHNLK